jgi:hypothetical protein
VRGGGARGLAGLSVVDICHITVHLVLLLAFDFAGLTCKATRAASVNASFTPRLRMAEHSVYRSVSEDVRSSLVPVDVFLGSPTYQGI